MNITIESVHLENFKTFAKSARFNVGGVGSSFTLLTGRNELRPSMGGNATGKSTIWDALCWCLYGRTVRGVRAGNVVNWAASKKSCQVSVTVRRDGVRRIISRQQSPNRLTWVAGTRLSDVDQSQLEDWLGLSYYVFTNTIILGQFGRFFFDFLPSEKLALFNGLLGLDAWHGYSMAARDKADGYIKTSEQLRQSAAELSGKIQEARKGLRETRSSVVPSPAPLEDEKRRLTYKLSAVSERKRGTVAKLDAAEKRLKTAEEKLEASRAALEQPTKRLVALRVTLRAAKRERRGIKRSFPFCPACRQTVTLEHRDKELARCDRRILGLRHKIKPVKDAILAIHQRVDHYSRIYGITYFSYRAHDTKLNRLNVKQQDIVGEIRDISKDLDVLMARQTAADSTAIVRKAARKRLQSFKGERHECRDKMRHAQRFEHLYRTLATTFKDVRLWVVDNVLRELEISINNNLVDLGLVGWEVRLVVERETAAGNISRGLNVLIRSPDQSDKKMVPWEVWSGGETQRLRVAGAAGLADMMLGRLGISVNLEVWDEPTQHLPSEGVSDLLDVLQRRAEVRCKRLFLVDHRSHESGLFDKRICVVRNKEGSELEDADG